MKLSEHFDLSELIDSQTATRRGIANMPGPDALANLTRVAGVLEQIRSLAGRPVVVSSGYRSPELNRAVGGAANSAHLTGLAADINVPGITPRALALLIRESGIVLDQLIFEGKWVHVGLSAGAPRRQVLTAKFNAGRASYIEGIS